MFITRDNEKLYLSNFEYNTARVLNALSTVVENNGGTVKHNEKTALICNRTLIDSIGKCNRTIEAATNNLKSGIIPAERVDNCNGYIARQKTELERLVSIKNDFIPANLLSYIKFKLDNTYYYFSVDSNPFFKHHFLKAPITDGKMSRDACMDELNRDWIYDCLFTFDCCNADVIEIANQIFNMLLSTKNSVVRLDSKRVRVQNYYNSGYHYETVTAPERFEKLDF